MAHCSLPPVGSAFWYKTLNQIGRLSALSPRNFFTKSECEIGFDFLTSF